MAHPKRRHSHSRTHKRRSHDKVGLPGVQKNAETGEVTLRHRVSPDGTYRGKQILDVKKED